LDAEARLAVPRLSEYGGKRFMSSVRLLPKNHEEAPFACHLRTVWAAT